MNKVIDILRYTKRRFLTQGFAKTVYLFLKEIEKENKTPHHLDGKYLVNLSFDFELGFGTTFWEENIEKALSYGETARLNFVPIMKFLEQEKISANVQIVGALLNEHPDTLSIFNLRQREAMRERRHLFKLTAEDIQLLRSHNIEAGIHGFSHRHFTNISAQDAEYEMQNAVENFKRVFERIPEFMAFPKNEIAHTDILKKHGIKCWRANSEHPKDESEIPLGHWFAPGVLDPHDLQKLLSVIWSFRKGYLLHLWGHFTEMDVDTFKELVGVIKNAGWKFTNVKDYKKY